jgi:hypothetical protein
MIADFAIEPRVMAQWRYFQMLEADFGVPQGRFISRFPGGWVREVAQLAHQLSHDSTNRPVDAKRIEEKLLGEAFRRKVVPSRRPYDTAKTWLVNATACDGELAFHAIVAESNLERHRSVVVAGEFLRSEPPYYVEPGRKVARTVTDLVACAMPLLRVSEELVLVDPNFRVWDPRSGRVVYRFLDTLEELLDRRVKMPHRLRRLELHLERREDTPGQYERRKFAERLAKHVPRGVSLRVFLWQAKPQGERLHPRFLLTEYGGIKYDYGLDEGGPGERTIVTLLPEHLWSELRQDYCEAGTTFTIDRSNDVFFVKGD